MLGEVLSIIIASHINIIIMCGFSVRYYGVLLCAECIKIMERGENTI